MRRAWISGTRRRGRASRPTTRTRPRRRPVSGPRRGRSRSCAPGSATATPVLADAGCEVHVFDRSPVPLTARGAGIVLHPATVRWWREHDVRPLAEMSAAMRRLRYLDADGAVTHEQPCRYRVSSFDAL